jgi:hypothetical protein
VPLVVGGLPGAHTAPARAKREPDTFLLVLPVKLLQRPVSRKIPVRLSLYTPHIIPQMSVIYVSPQLSFSRLSCHAIPPPGNRLSDTQNGAQRGYRRSVQGAAVVSSLLHTGASLGAKKKGLRVSAKPLEMIDDFGAGGRNRTDTTRGSGDFESPASTNFTTPARTGLYGSAIRPVKNIWAGKRDTSAGEGQNNLSVRRRTPTGSINYAPHGGNGTEKP